MNYIGLRFKQHLYNCRNCKARSVTRMSMDISLNGYFLVFSIFGRRRLNLISVLAFWRPVYKRFTSLRPESCKKGSAVLTPHFFGTFQYIMDV